MVRSQKSMRLTQRNGTSRDRDRFGLQAYTEIYTAVTTSTLSPKARPQDLYNQASWPTTGAMAIAVLNNLLLLRISGKALAKTPSYGGLEPAIVISAADDHLMLLLRYEFCAKLGRWVR